MQLYNVVKRVRVMCKRVRLADCIATIFFLASLYNQSKNENELLHGIWMFIKKTQIRMSTFLFLFFVSNFFSLLLSEINSGNLHFNVISMNVTRSSMVKFNNHRHSFETATRNDIVAIIFKNQMHRNCIGIRMRRETNSMNYNSEVQFKVQ